MTVSGGHTLASIPTEQKYDIGAKSTAFRTATIKYTTVPVKAGIDATKVAHAVYVRATIQDNGPPAGATLADAAKYPKLTAIRSKDGDDKFVKKTLFPTTWTKDVIRQNVRFSRLGKTLPRRLTSGSTTARSIKVIG